ncbi:MAG: RNA-binding transcriptional accessory protein, partial [Candidatus Eremiobacteraeota bacterium]|nr:RNA-binding transcriptional accessory protein [Candidatus Eremiobacteraeota bacterium]
SRKVREFWTTKLEQRRESIVGSLTEQGVFEGALKEKILKASTLTELEDLYLPFKPKRKTRATKARELGLEPLAQMVVRQPRDKDVKAEARRFLSSDVSDVEQALSGARDIVAEWAAEKPEVRSEIRTKARKFGKLKAGRRRGAEDPREVYQAYYEFNSPINRVAPHQVLALDRGEREKVLSLSLDLQERDWRDALKREFRV